MTSLKQFYLLIQVVVTCKQYKSNHIMLQNVFEILIDFQFMENQTVLQSDILQIISYDDELRETNKKLQLEEDINKCCKNQ
jgi:hypothetical protein